MRMRSYFTVFQAATKTAPKITQLRLHANALLFSIVIYVDPNTAPKITQVRLHANAFLFHCISNGNENGT